jgi:hypothetical protein
MADTLRITLAGMGLVFAAMVLVLVAMVLLVRLRDAGLDAQATAVGQASPDVGERALKLRVAVMAAAIACAQADATRTLNLPNTPAANSWWAHHHIRQLDNAPRTRR